MEAEAGVPRGSTFRLQNLQVPECLIEVKWGRLAGGSRRLLSALK
jgi:hypothetical protein